MRVMRRFHWPAPKVRPGLYQPWSARVLDITPQCDRAPFEVEQFELDVLIGGDAPEAAIVGTVAWVEKVLGEMGISKGRVMIGANVLIAGAGDQIQVTLWEADT